MPQTNQPDPAKKGGTMKEDEQNETGKAQSPADQQQAGNKPGGGKPGGGGGGTADRGKGK